MGHLIVTFLVRILESMFVVGAIGSVVVLVLPNLALLTLAVILSAILIVSGLEMVVSGATGVSKYAAAV